MGGGTYHGPVIQGGDVHIHLSPGAPATPGAPGGPDPWTDAADRSAVWDHVPAGRDTTVVRQYMLAVVAALAGVCDGAAAALADDPWQDPGLAVRFAEQVEWLLGEPDPDGPFELFPAEAALLVLLPFLYRANQLRAAARWAPVVTPGRLGPVAGAGAERQSFEAFGDEYGMLLERTRLRPESAGPIGWWLFHRWQLHRGMLAEPADVAELLGLVAEQAGPLGEILDATRVTRLLHGIRRGPDVANIEFLDHLPAEDRLRGPGHQRVRDRRLVLLLTLAHSTCLDLTALPDIVVEHLGIPHPVDLGELRGTVDRAVWGGEATLPVLRAECHHEAVIEGLRAHTARADEILHAVDRAGRERITCAMPRLPARLSADQVRPASGVFDGWAGFRTDERKVRELLMGVQLYKDRDLAVRELYQNALDACRYRRARTEYLDRTGPASWAYEGRITFEQGVDEHGRAYVECRDNGIGMGDAELRGVFSQAGARFAEQPEFKLERAAWNRLDPPVELYPNSRFGIGVLSYFMLADELTVTTCRMGPDGRPGPVLEVAIHGPGHLFRIVQRAPWGEESGTVVRLHLRDSVTAGAEWSCVDVLERVLGVAEFGTTAVQGERRAKWQAGQLQVREQPERERFGFDAHGGRVDWADAPKGVRVTWTEHGGALLVDGLVVQPAVRRGVLSTEGAGLSGVVVDLTGPYAPAQLSADRAEVLDDLAAPLLELLAPATEALVVKENELPTYGWVCRIALGSPQLADLLTEAATRVGLTLELGGRSFPTVRTGVFPADVELLSMYSAETSQRIDSWAVTGFPPDYVFLWRLLANAPHPLLDELAAFCPELRNDVPVLVAMPSDQLLLSENGSRDYWSWHADGYWSGAHLAGAVARWGVKLRDAARRAAGLGLHGVRPEGFPERLPLPAVVESTLRRAPGGFPDRVTVTDLVRAAGDDRRRLREVADTWRGLGIAVPEGIVPLARKAMVDELLRRDGDSPRYGWFTVGETVPTGRIAQASVQYGISVTEVCALFAGYGLTVDPAGLPQRLPSWTLPIFRNRSGESSPWWEAGRPLPPWQVLGAAAGLRKSPAETLWLYRAFGFRVPEVFPVDASVDDLALFEDHWLGERFDQCAPAPFPYLLILREVAGRSLPDVIARLADYGFPVPLRPPSAPDELDEQLLDPDGPCSWWEVRTGEPMPFAHLLVAAQTTFRPLNILLERFDLYGVPVSCREVPEGLTAATALELLGTRYRDDGFLSKTSSVTLAMLLERADRMRVPVRQIVDWLTELGIPVPDLGQLLRDALARVPRP